MADEKKYKVESIDVNGPIEEELSLKDTVDKLNKERANGRMVFIDGAPVADDLITEESVSKCKKGISIVNQLIGG